MSRKTDYLPFQEALLVTWTNEFLRNITPAPENYGLTKTDASDYQTVQQLFVDAYNTVQNPMTRTPPNIEAKNVAKKTLIDKTRALVDVCQAWPQMTNEKRRELNITERGKKPTPSPIPTQAFVKVENVNGREVTISIQQSKTTKSKPKGVQGANIMVAYSNELPETTTGWTFAQTTGKTKTTITLDAVSEACTVWISAFWFNGRKETGPASTPVSVNLGATAVMPGTQKLKIAA